MSTMSVGRIMKSFGERWFPDQPFRERLLGAAFVVKSIALFDEGSMTDEPKSIKITALDGREILLRLKAECCSESYFEKNSLSDLQSIVGETLTDIEQISSALTGVRPERSSWDEVVNYHALKVTTDKQVVVVDWRNESNGYYDGDCDILGPGPP